MPFCSNKIRFLGIGLAGLLLVSCGYYSFKGSLPSNLKTVAIPLFNDKTAYPNIREKLTDYVITKFVEDNTLAIVDETLADVIVYGTINSITQKAVSVEQGETTSQYKLTISVKVKVEDLRNSKVLFEKTIQQYGLLNATAGLEERDQVIDATLLLIGDEIVDSTIGSW